MNCLERDTQGEFNAIIIIIHRKALVQREEKAPARLPLAATGFGCSGVAGSVNMTRGYHVMEILTETGRWSDRWCNSSKRAPSVMGLQL